MPQASQKEPVTKCTLKLANQSRHSSIYTEEWRMGGPAGGLGWEVGVRAQPGHRHSSRRDQLELRAGQGGAGHRECVIQETPGSHLPAGPT